MINKIHVAAALCLLLVAGSFALVDAATSQPSSSLEWADSLFKAGKFAEAEKIYAQTVSRDPRNYAAALRLGSIALLANELDDARKWFQQARKIRPTDFAVNLPLAEVYCRRDDFQKAAPLLRAAGKPAQADTLASFQGVTPYDVQGPGTSATVKFVMADPLPLVQVKINGGRDRFFLLDTGASEILLDSDLARQLGIKQFGSEAGTFAGGKKSAVGHGKINSITLGDWVVKNVPVEIVNTRQHAPLFGGKQIDGILGAAFFYHFLTTIDYPNGKLVLRRKTEDNLSRLKTDLSTDSTIVPFWMAGDHFIVAWCRINNLDPVLLLVDTGSAGGAVKLTESVLKDAGIKLSHNQTFEGVGGGGKLESIPFKLKELSLAGATQYNVRGWCQSSFPWEHSLGFRLGGMIGHDFLKAYAVTFDFDGMRIILEPKPATR